MKYQIVNDKTSVFVFTVEADSPEEAALVALNLLGWYIAEPEENE